MDLHALLTPLGAQDRRVKSRLGTFTPVGVILHHTASHISQDPVPSLRIVREGRSDLPGPLCNVLVGRDGSIHTITDGKANDSGGGDPDVLAAVKANRPLPKADDTKATRVDGNAWFYDIEVENDGVGEPYSDRVLTATAQVAAAILRAHGWGLQRLLRHRDWTTRKIDWSWQGDHRALVGKYLLAPDHPPEDDDMQPDERLWLKAVFDAVFLAPDGSVLPNPQIGARVMAMHGGNYKTPIGGDLSWLSQHLDAQRNVLLGQIDTLEGAGADPAVIVAAVKQALREGSG